MAWENVQVMGINGTKMTAYGATVCNYGDYHDIIMSESGTAGYKKYSDIIVSMGYNYFNNQIETLDSEGKATWGTAYTTGKFTIEYLWKKPYYDNPEKYPTHFQYSSGLRILYDGEVIGARSSLTSGKVPSGQTLDTISRTDYMCLGFIIDRSRSIGQVLIWSHNSANNAYFWYEDTATSPTRKYATVYNIVTGNMLDYQAINYITGKNKTYNLSKILTINYGDPVSNAAASSVNLLTESRLDNMINSN